VIKGRLSGKILNLKEIATKILPIAPRPRGEGTTSSLLRGKPSKSIGPKALSSGMSSILKSTSVGGSLIEVNAMIVGAAGRGSDRSRTRWSIIFLKIRVGMKRKKRCRGAKRLSVAWRERQGEILGREGRRTAFGRKRELTTKRGDNPDTAKRKKERGPESSKAFHPRGSLSLQRGPRSRKLTLTKPAGRAGRGEGGRSERGGPGRIAA